jgi:hypothetical protein
VSAGAIRSIISSNVRLRSSIIAEGLPDTSRCERRESIAVNTLRLVAELAQTEGLRKTPVGARIASPG